MYSKELTGEAFGVKIPSWLRVFDCRGEAMADKLPNGIVLFGSEKAAYDLGLRTVGPYEHNDATPLSCNTYIDARDCPESELKRQLESGIKEATRFLTSYQDALANPAKEGEGGGCYELPVAIALCNFGWSIITDRRQRAVKAFQKW